MSEEHVAAVLGPPWVRDALDYERAFHQQAEKTILALRRKLRAADPTLPNEYDGTTWSTLEQEYLLPPSD